MEIITDIVNNEINTDGTFKLDKVEKTLMSIEELIDNNEKLYNYISYFQECYFLYH